MMFKKQIGELIEIKNIMALILIIVFAYLAFKGELGKENVMNVVTFVIGYYFGRENKPSVEEEEEPTKKKVTKKQKGTD